MEPSAPGAGAGLVGTRRPGTKPGWAAGQQAQRLLGHLALLRRLPEVLSRGPQPHLPLTCCWLAGTGPAPAWASGCGELGRVGGGRGGPRAGGVAPVAEALAWAPLWEVPA